MPANLNPDLREVIHPADYGNLSQDREKIRNLLAALSPDSYGSESSVAGTLYKTGPRTAIMLFATDDSAEIYELTK